MRRFGFIIIAFVLVLSACSKDEDIPIAYQIESFGFVKGNTILDDNGFSYQIVENASGTDYSSKNRVYYLFDVLRKISDKEYEIRLRYIFEPLTKDAVAEDKVKPEDLGDDPIYISAGWVSGGYLNLALQFSYLEGSTNKHALNLVVEDPAATDTLRFQLRHNGFGEGRMTDEDADKMSTGYTFACFRAEQLLPDGRESMPIKISAPWYLYNGDGTLSPNLEYKVTRGTLKK